jgi:hypothetical protein
MAKKTQLRKGGEFNFKKAKESFNANIKRIVKVVIA